MRIESVHPFLGYRVYKVFHKKMSRWQVSLWHETTHERRTLLYSKFVMSAKLGRWLRKDEEVDHIDGNKLNDDLSNLEIVTPKENRRRRAVAHPEKTVTLACGYCRRTFTRARRQTSFSKPGQADNYCSRSCNALARGCSR